MKKVKGEHWKVEGNVVRLQIRTEENQAKLQEFLPGWHCVSYGYVPSTNEDIYVFEKDFYTEIEWNEFLSSKKTNSLFEMKEVKND